MHSEVLTIDEVAKFLRVSADTVYRLVARGELVGRKIGRIWRIPRSAVEHYLACDPSPDISIAGACAPRAAPAVVEDQQE